MKSIFSARRYLAAALTCIILFTSEGGTVYGSGLIRNCGASLAFVVVTLGGFIYEETAGGGADHPARAVPRPHLPAELRRSALLSACR